MAKDVTVINGAGRLAAKLEKLGALGAQAIQEVIDTTTALAQGKIQDKITGRKLVDTGFYLASWQIQTEPNRGKVATNCEYALVLEYGFDGDEEVKAHTRQIDGKTVNVKAHTRHVSRKGFGVIRDVAIEMRPIFFKRMQEKVKELLSE